MLLKTSGIAIVVSNNISSTYAVSIMLKNKMMILNVNIVMSTGKCWFNAMEIFKRKLNEIKEFIYTYYNLNYIVLK